MLRFIITRDHIAEQWGDEPTKMLQVGNTDTRNFPYPFALHDDDDEIYFTGRARDEGESLIAAFEWGMVYAGITMLKQAGEVVIG